MFGIIYAFSGLIKFFIGGKNKKNLFLFVDEKYKGPLVYDELWDHSWERFWSSG